MNLLSAQKILSAEQIRSADTYTIQNEPIASIDLMERASSAFFDWFTNKFDKSNNIKVFCGIGNNGGDGLAIARLLIEKKFSLNVYVIGNLHRASPDFLINHEKLKPICEVMQLSTKDDLPIIDTLDIVIDGLFGSGLNRSADGFYAEVIRHINSSECRGIVAIDIPSGLFSDNTTIGDNIIKATNTISFQSPKLSFLLPNSGPYCGDFSILDIGLSKSYIQKLSSNYYFVNQKFIQSIFKKRGNFLHKGGAGKCLIVSGSKGKIGAAILATNACLRSGAGLVTVHTPQCGYIPLQTAVPEAMVIEDPLKNEISIIEDIEKYDAIGIGPGIGTSKVTSKAFSKFIKAATKPLVIDADALNILSEDNSLLNDIPEQSIITPHPGEFKRLVGNWDDDFERLEKQISLSKKHKIIVLLKGPFTSISNPEGLVFFNSTGNSGMATAGSGDVLTGIITSLLGQGYNPYVAAILGAYIHGLSGDIYIRKNSKEGLIARDLINHLPKTLSKISSL